MNRPLHVTFGFVGSSRDRVREHRERLRKQGLRPIQIWVPDVHAPEFVAEARRQSLLSNASEHAADDMAFAEALAWEMFEDIERAEAGD